MRILQISSAKVFGGSERHFVDLCRELALRGHDVFVAIRPTNEWSSRLDFIPPENFLYTSIRNPFGMFNAKRLAAFAERNQVDVLHAHVARDYVTASIACRAAGSVRLVLTRHVTFPMKSFHRFALRNVAAAIAISPLIRPHLERVFATNKIHIIPNGIAIKQDEMTGPQRPGYQFRSLHNIAPDAPLVVTLGDLKIARGQRDLVLAANEIVPEFPECRFVIAGRDDSIDHKFRRELKRLVKVLGLDENVIWLGWLDDIDPMLDAADVFVSPSHTRIFGATMIAAMAAGCPVVATDTGIAHELLPPNLLTPVKDPLALSECICALLSDADMRHAAGENLRASVMENYRIESMVDATEAVYRKVFPQ